MGIYSATESLQYERTLKKKTCSFWTRISTANKKQKWKFTWIGHWRSSTMEFQLVTIQSVAIISVPLWWIETIPLLFFSPTIRTKNHTCIHQLFDYLLFFPVEFNILIQFITFYWSTIMNCVLYRFLLFNV